MHRNLYLRCDVIVSSSSNCDRIPWIFYFRATEVYFREYAYFEKQKIRSLCKRLPHWNAVSSFESQDKILMSVAIYMKLFSSLTLNFVTNVLSSCLLTFPLGHQNGSRVFFMVFMWSKTHMDFLMWCHPTTRIPLPTNRGRERSIYRQNNFVFSQPIGQFYGGINRDERIKSVF